MKQEGKPIYHRKVLLEKYPGKGGWTYAILEDIQIQSNRKFNLLPVRGSIDGFSIQQYNLFSLKDGKRFLPIKKEIRKIIGKSEGDLVEVILFIDDSPLVIPDEILICLNDDLLIKSKFEKLSDGRKKYYVDWIMKGKQWETRANRIAKMMIEIDQLRH